MRNTEEQKLKRICVDMDEVMADTLAEHLRRYNQAFDRGRDGRRPGRQGAVGDHAADRQQELRAFLDAEDFFEDLAADARRAGSPEAAFSAL